MLKALPVRSNALSLAEKAAQFEGSIDKPKMNRLSKACINPCERVDYKLAFSLVNGEYKLSMDIEADVSLECQRCLKPFIYRVMQHVDVHLVKPENEVLAADQDWDFCVLEKGGVLDIHQLIEDELMLSLPLVPMHEHDPCIV